MQGFFLRDPSEVTRGTSSSHPIESIFLGGFCWNCVLKKRSGLYNCGRRHDGEVSSCDLASGRERKKKEERKKKREEGLMVEE